METHNTKNDLIGKQFPVLNSGYVMLVDVMGSDAEIARAARVSYGEGTKKVHDDAGLIDHLMRMRHTSPFEMAELKFEIKVPIFVERQWVRHRMCSMNEISGRFSVLPNDVYCPDEDVVRAQSKTNKQGREEKLPENVVEEFLGNIKENACFDFQSYDEALQVGVARELARIQLPLGTYTKKVWKMDLHNLLHFLKLRTDPHAQWEIRQYAEIIEKIVAELFPITYASWKNHLKDAVSFSADETVILKTLTIHKIGDSFKLTDCPEWDQLSSSRKSEFLAKLQKVFEEEFLKAISSTEPVTLERKNV